MTDVDVQNLIKEFRVPFHIQRHCETVSDFAVELAKHLIDIGEKIDIQALKHAALLHDLLRVVDFRHPPLEDLTFWENLRKKYAGIRHEEAAAKILEERGEPFIAEIIRKHRFIQIEKGFANWEEKLLYYADKRAKHDKIVPLRERLEDGRKRNMPEKANKEESDELDRRVFELEREILGKITPLQ
jgi:putative nucleotidyltransferase with HDIG domain